MSDRPIRLVFEISGEAAVVTGTQRIAMSVSTAFAEAGVAMVGSMQTATEKTLALLKKIADYGASAPFFASNPAAAQLLNSHLAEQIGNVSRSAFPSPLPIPVAAIAFPGVPHPATSAVPASGAGAGAVPPNSHPPTTAGSPGGGNWRMPPAQTAAEADQVNASLVRQKSLLEGIGGAWDRIGNAAIRFSAMVYSFERVGHDLRHWLVDPVVDLGERIVEADEQARKFVYSVATSVGGIQAGWDLHRQLVADSRNLPVDVTTLQESAKVIGFAPALAGSLAFADSTRQQAEVVERLATLTQRLAAIDPQQGERGATMAIRQVADGGPAGFTSLRRRFGISQSTLARMVSDQFNGDVSAALEQLHTDPALAIRALQRYADIFLPASATGQFGNLISVRVQKLRDVINEGFVRIGESGVFDHAVDRLRGVADALFQHLGSEQFEGQAQRISDSLDRITGNVGGMIQKFLEAVTGAKGDNTVGGAVELATKAIEGLSTASDMLPSAGNKLGQWFNSVAGGIQKVIDGLNGLNEISVKVGQVKDAALSPATRIDQMSDRTQAFADLTNRVTGKELVTTREMTQRQIFQEDFAREGFGQTASSTIRQVARPFVDLATGNSDKKQLVPEVNPDYTRVNSNYLPFVQDAQQRIADLGLTSQGGKFTSESRVIDILRATAQKYHVILRDTALPPETTAPSSPTVPPALGPAAPIVGAGEPSPSGSTNQAESIAAANIARVAGGVAGGEATGDLLESRRRAIYQMTRREQAPTGALGPASGAVGPTAFTPLDQIDFAPLGPTFAPPPVEAAPTTQATTQPVLPTAANPAFQRRKPAPEIDLSRVFVMMQAAQKSLGDLTGETNADSIQQFSARFGGALTKNLGPDESSPVRIADVYQKMRDQAAAVSKKLDSRLDEVTGGGVMSLANPEKMLQAGSLVAKKFTLGATEEQAEKALRDSYLESARDYGQGLSTRLKDLPAFAAADVETRIATGTTSFAKSIFDTLAKAGVEFSRDAVTKMPLADRLLRDRQSMDTHMKSIQDTAQYGQLTLGMTAADIDFMRGGRASDRQVRDQQAFYLESTARPQAAARLAEARDAYLTNPDGEGVRATLAQAEQGYARVIEQAHQLRDANNDMLQSFKAFGESVRQSLETGVGDTLYGLISGTQTLTQSMRNLVNSLLRDFTQLASKNLFQALLGDAGKPQSNGGTGALSGLLGLAFQGIGALFKGAGGGPAVGGVGDSTGGFGPGGFGGGADFHLADGGFLNSFRPFQAFSAGGIAHKPTLGLVGERSDGIPEAVIPLLAPGRTLPLGMDSSGNPFAVLPGGRSITASFVDPQHRYADGGVVPGGFGGAFGGYSPIFGGPPPIYGHDGGAGHAVNTGGMKMPDVHVHIQNMTDTGPIVDAAADIAILKHGEKIVNHTLGKVARGMLPGGNLRRVASKNP